MFLDDEAKPLKQPITLPRHLDGLSACELEEYITMLQEEITRTQKELSTQGTHKSAAEAAFR
jgi:uncharacterized small protein (DUF1192 family)